MHELYYRTFPRLIIDFVVFYVLLIQEGILDPQTLSVEYKLTRKTGNLIGI